MNQKYKTRAGITITEALASIAVAAVGLFAVIAVIPFAARQTEAGLNLDVSVSVGKNAFHDFDVRGMGNGKNWRLANIDVNPSGIPNGQYWLGKAFVIDPLYLTLNDPVANPQISIFPYPLYNQDEMNANRLPPTAPVMIGQSGFGIDRINMSALGTAFNFAQAESIFRSVNELLYDEPADKLFPPNQQFKRDGTVDLKRSYAGKISWMAMMVPETSPDVPNEANPQMYRLYVVVFKGRQLKYRAANPKGEVLYNGRLQFNPAAGVSPNGGIVDLDIFEPPGQLPTGPATGNNLIQDDFLQNGDWLLLTDYFRYNSPPPLQIDTSTHVDSNGKNWRWYQVQRVDPAEPSQQTGTIRTTLVGPDWTGRDVNTATPGIWDVHVIAMSNVVAVYEKTIRVEYDSIWND